MQRNAALSTEFAGYPFYCGICLSGRPLDACRPKNRPRLIEDHRTPTSTTAETVPGLKKSLAKATAPAEERAQLDPFGGVGLQRTVSRRGVIVLTGHRSLPAQDADPRLVGGLAARPSCTYLSFNKSLGSRFDDRRIWNSYQNA